MRQSLKAWYILEGCLLQGQLLSTKHFKAIVWFCHTFTLLPDVRYTLQATKAEITNNRIWNVPDCTSWYVTNSVVTNLLCILWTADVDECAGNTDMCHHNATCNNNEGSYTCSCNTGYTGSGLSCTSKCVYIFKSKHVTILLNMYYLQLYNIYIYHSLFAYQLSIASFSELKSFPSEWLWRQPQSILWKAYSLV